MIPTSQRHILPGPNQIIWSKSCMKWEEDLQQNQCQQHLQMNPLFVSKIQKGCRLYLMIGLLKTHLDMISNSMCFSFTKLREAIFSILFNKLNTTQMNLPLYFAAKSVVCDVRKSCAYQLSTNIYHIP